MCCVRCCCGRFHDNSITRSDGPDYNAVVESIWTRHHNRQKNNEHRSVWCSQTLDVNSSSTTSHRGVACRWSLTSRGVLNTSLNSHSGDIPYVAAPGGERGGGLSYRVRYTCLWLTNKCIGLDTIRPRPARRQVLPRRECHENINP